MTSITLPDASSLHQVKAKRKLRSEAISWHGWAIKLPDVVATLEDVPASPLAKGQVGTIVDELSENFVLVEFADLDGVAYALESIPVGKLIELRHTPAVAA